MIEKQELTIPFIYKFIVRIFVFIGVFSCAVVFGAADTTIRDIWLAVTTDATGEAVSIVRDIRLPRENAATFVGAALAVSGAIMQGMTRNPLADPGLLGFTAGANGALAIT